MARGVKNRIAQERWTSNQSGSGGRAPRPKARSRRGARARRRNRDHRLVRNPGALPRRLPGRGHGLAHGPRCARAHRLGRSRREGQARIGQSADGRASSDPRGSRLRGRRGLVISRSTARRSPTRLSSAMSSPGPGRDRRRDLLRRAPAGARLARACSGTPRGLGDGGHGRPLPMIPSTALGWAIVLMLGLVSHAMGQALTSIAVGRAPVGLIAVVILAQPPFSALFARGRARRGDNRSADAGRRRHSRGGAAVAPCYSVSHDPNSAERNSASMTRMLAMASSIGNSSGACPSTARENASPCKAY